MEVIVLRFETKVIFTRTYLINILVYDHPPKNKLALPTIAITQRALVTPAKTTPKIDYLCYRPKNNAVYSLLQQRKPPTFHSRQEHRDVR